MTPGGAAGPLTGTFRPNVAGMLRTVRDARGWSKSGASRQTGVSRRMITLLERGERYPSTLLAETLIAGYGLSQPQAARLREVALPGVGRASPYRTGKWAAPRPDSMNPALSARSMNSAFRPSIDPAVSAPSMNDPGMPVPCNPPGTRDPMRGPSHQQGERKEP